MPPRADASPAMRWESQTTLAPSAYAPSTTGTGRSNKHRFTRWMSSTPTLRDEDPAASPAYRVSQRVVGNLSKNLLGKTDSLDEKGRAKQLEVASRMKPAQRAAVEFAMASVALDRQQDRAVRMQHMVAWLSIQQVNLAMATATEMPSIEALEAQPDYTRAVGNLLEMRKALEIESTVGDARDANVLLRRLQTRPEDLDRLIHDDHRAILDKRPPPIPVEVALMIMDEVARAHAREHPHFLAQTFASLAQTHKGIRDYTFERLKRFGPATGIPQSASLQSLMRDCSENNLHVVLKNNPYVALPNMLGTKKTYKLLCGLESASDTTLAKTVSIHVDLPEDFFAPVDPELPKTSPADKAEQLSRAIDNLGLQGGNELGVHLTMNLCGQAALDPSVIRLARLPAQEGSRLTRLSLEAALHTQALDNAVLAGLGHRHCRVVDATLNIRASAATLLEVLRMAIDKDRPTPLEALDLTMCERLTPKVVADTLTHEHNRLKSLKVDLSGLDANGAPVLTDALLDSANQLETLVVRAGDGNTDGAMLGMGMAGAVLRDGSQLKHLSLDYLGPHENPGDAMRELGKAVMQPTCSLRTLNFSDCTFPSAQSVVDLIGAAGHPGSLLEVLYLDPCDFENHPEVRRAIEQARQTRPELKIVFDLEKANPSWK